MYCSKKKSVALFSKESLTLNRLKPLVVAVSRGTGASLRFEHVLGAPEVGQLCPGFTLSVRLAL